MNKWDKVTYQSCKPARPDFTQAKVIKVYDGDTVTLGTLDLNRYSCRIFGIDTAEMRTKDKIEKEHAIASRDFLRSRIGDQVVLVNIVGTDKYGRVLAVLECNGENINQLMMRDGGAVEYNGGTKPETDWKIVKLAASDETVSDKRKSS